MLGRFWTADEDRFIRLHPTMPVPQVMHHLPGRTHVAVLTRRKLLWVAKRSSPGWSLAETDILRKLSPRLTDREIHRHLPHRTVRAIGTKRRKMGIQRGQQKRLYAPTGLVADIRQELQKRRVPLRRALLALGADRTLLNPSRHHSRRASYGELLRVIETLGGELSAEWKD